MSPTQFFPVTLRLTLLNLGPIQQPEEQTMKTNTLAALEKLTVLCAALAVTGCSSTGDKSSGGATAAGQTSSKAKADDGRTVDIGKASPASGGGVNYKNPHM